MKNVYFIQTGVDFGNSIYIPYAAGTIIANCKRFDDIAAEYCFPEIIFERKLLADSLEIVRDPYIAAFSNNIWNVEYNKALARMIKEKYPACLIVFGGHSVYNPELLCSEPYIDILIFGEGERAFAELLRALSAGDLNNVPSIAYRKNGKTVRNPAGACEDLADYPSPYISGVFDPIIENNPGRDFSAVLETNRGCPYSCAFCDWTHGKKMRFFPMEKIEAEVLWMAKHQIEFVYCIDSNFGLFERDMQIVDLLVRTKKRYGYPKVFRVNYEKNSADRVFEICKTLNEVRMDRGATLSYQTLSPEALKNIGRVNLTMEHFSGLMDKYREAGIATYSELILGFPGETYESFCRGICRLMENGQHCALYTYLCELLPNAVMSDPDYVKKHQIEGIKVYFQNAHSVADKEEEVHEFSHLVHATATMSVRDWVRANIFSICVQCFHFIGALRYLPIYLYKENICGYFDFYNGLTDYLLASPGKMGGIFRDLKSRYDNDLQGNWLYYNPAFGNVNWPHEEGAFLEAVNDYDACISEIMPYLKTFGIPEPLFSDIMKYQDMMLKKPCDGEAEAEFSYDLPVYYETTTRTGDCPPKRGSIFIRRKPEVVYNDVEKYAREVVWYGRRREASIYSRSEIRCESRAKG